MRKEIKGFTLVELLVVVLIIGILAAVALPQYNKAVARTRLSTLKNLTVAIAQAQEVYYMENNAYATKFSDLDVQMPEGTPNEDDNVITYSWGECNLTDTTNTQCRYTPGKMFFLVYHNTHASYGGQRMCQADKGTIYEQVCKADTGDTSCLNWGTGGSRPTCRYK